MGRRPFVTCTPTGHTFNILTQLLEETNATLEKAVAAYAMLGIGENDAFIACWEAKFDYSLIRPVSYIQKYIDAVYYRNWHTSFSGLYLRARN